MQVYNFGFGDIFYFIVSLCETSECCRVTDGIVEGGVAKKKKKKEEETRGISTGRGSSKGKELFHNYMVDCVTQRCAHLV